MSGGVQQAPTPYQPQNQAGADTGFQQGVGQLATAGTNLYNSVSPQLSSAVSGITNNPYYAQAQQGAQTAANTATNLVAPQQLQSSQNIAALGQLSNPAALQTLYTAFDPQQALYQQQYQQQLDQSNATNSMYGLGTSPYGAGVANQASTNFNIDWQNAQLARQIAALGAYDTNLSAAGGAATTASNLGAAGLNTQVTAAALPYNLATQQGMNSLAALGSQAQVTNQALSPTQQAIGDQGTYLGIGQTASQGAIQAAQANNQANAQAAAGFGQLFGDVLGMFNPLSFLGGGAIKAGG